MGVIHQKFEELRTNYNTLEVLKFDEFLHTCESTEIIEDFKSVFVEPMRGAQFAKEFVLTNSFGHTDLTTMKTTLESYLEKAEENHYANFEHVSVIEDTLDLINAKLLQQTESCIAELLIDSLYIQEVQAVSESAMKDERTLKHILSKDLSDEDKVKLANRFVEKLKHGTFLYDSMLDISNFATVTTIILYTATVAIPIAVVGLLIPTPILICTNLVKKGAKKSLRKAYLRAFKSELRKVESVINAGKGNTDIVKYKQNLLQSIDMLQNVDEKITLEATLEAVSVAETLDESLNELDNAILENFYNFAFREDETVEESIEWFNNIVALSNTKSVIIEETLENILVTEGSKSSDVRKKINVGANKLKSSAQKIKDKAKTAGQTAAAAKNHVDKAGKAMDDAATNAVNKTKNVYRNDVRGEIIESKTTVKFGRIIRKGIMIGSLTLVNPALGAIGALTTLALRKSVKAKEKKKILNELQEELEIVNEKIEDSRGDENKEKKYQLMRIRNKLQRDITRIQYGIKAEDKGV